MHASLGQPFLWFVLTAACVLTFQNCANDFKPASDEAIENAQTANQKYNVTVTSSSDAISSSASQTFTFGTTGHDGEIISYTCQLDQAAPVACASPFTPTNLTDLHHVLLIEGQTVYGTTAAVGVYQFTVDRTPPQLTLTQSPGAVIGTAAATVAFSAVDALTGTKDITCSLDGAAMQTVANPYTTASLNEGAHRVSCQTTDGAGNISNVVTASWTTSLTAPALQLDKSLPAFTLGTNHITFTAKSTTGEVVTTTCSLDGGAFTACASGQTFSGLGAGSHTITVKGVDALARQSTAAYTWMVDLTPPTVRFTTVSPVYTNATSLPVGFTADDGTGSGLGSCQCATGTAGGYAACANPFNLTGAEGVATLSVKCEDAVGNMSAPNTFSVTFDRTPPTLKYTSDVVALSANQTATFNLVGTDALSNPVRYQVQLDGGTFADAPATDKLTGLSDGKHTLFIKAIDQAGNASAIQSQSWTVDTQPPTNPASIKYTGEFETETSIVWAGSVDAGSGLDHYDFKIGTAEGGDDILKTTSSTSASYLIPLSTLLVKTGSTYEYILEDRITYVSVRAVDKLGNATPWVSSGPTNPNLYGGTFPYQASCGFGNQCMFVSKLDTSAAALKAGTVAGSPYFLMGSASSLVSVLTDFTADPLTDLSKQSSGSFTSTCSLDGTPFTCDMVKGTVIPGLIAETPQTLQITVYYNQEVFFQSTQKVLFSPKTLPAYSPAVYTTSSDAQIYKNISLDSFHFMLREVWVDTGLTANLEEMCSPANSADFQYLSNHATARLVARANSTVYLDDENYSFCDLKVDADSGSTLVIRDARINELDVAPGAAVYYEQGFGGATIVALKPLAAAIGDISTCPDSPTGSCPSDIVSYK